MTKPKVYKVEPGFTKGKYPQTLQTSTLEKFMDEAQLEAFFLKYQANSKRAGRGMTKPDAKDMLVVKTMRENGFSMKKTEDKLKMTTYQVLGALARAGAFNAITK